jgi:hypothetical protein
VTYAVASRGRAVASDHPAADRPRQINRVRIRRAPMMSASAGLAYCGDQRAVDPLCRAIVDESVAP